MTELEKQLLSALEQLQQDYSLEQAGAEFERAAAPVVERLNAVELRQQHERELQHQKMLEAERVQRQKTYNGPTLG